MDTPNLTNPGCPPTATRKVDPAKGCCDPALLAYEAQMHGQAQMYARLGKRPNKILSLNAADPTALVASGATAVLKGTLPDFADPDALIMDPADADKFKIVSYKILEVDQVRNGGAPYGVFAPNVPYEARHKPFFDFVLKDDAEVVVTVQNITAGPLVPLPAALPYYSDICDDKFQTKRAWVEDVPRGANVLAHLWKKFLALFGLGA